MDILKLTDSIAGLLAKTPQWIRHDLGVQDPALRLRAEESLAAVIAAGLIERDPAEQP